MGRSKHKDRAYITTQEWKYEWGGHKAQGHLPYKRLPFNCCAISFLPFEDAVRCTLFCTLDDAVLAYQHSRMTVLCRRSNARL